MITLVKIVRVEPVGGHRLKIWFSNGMAGEHDFSPDLAVGGSMVEPLRDTAYFARVFIELGVLAWPNGYDMDAIALHDDMSRAGELRRVSDAA
jgi:hypothetical protein